MLFLHTQHCGHDFRCPHCDTPLEVEWTTEYGDPLPGDYDKECPSCFKKLSISVEVTTTYRATKKE